MDTPLVTILTPTYNRAAYIAAALQSVLAQSYKNWELIVMDDASTDDTEKIVREFMEKEKSGTDNTKVGGTSKISYIKQPHNVGIARNRNTGLEKARGKYVAVLDSDDLWTDPEKLAKQVSLFEKNETNANDRLKKPKQKLGIVGTWVNKIDTKGKEIGSITYAATDDAIREKMLQQSQFAHSSTVFLRQAMLDAGGYSTDYIIGDDYDLMLRIGTKYSFANIPEFTTAYRIHDDNITKTKRAQHVREHLIIIKKYKHDYPGFWFAVVKSYLRIFFAYF